MSIIAESSIGQHCKALENHHNLNGSSKGASELLCSDHFLRER